jgi:hypothetical protein
MPGNARAEEDMIPEPHAAKKVSDLHALHDEQARNNVHVHNYVLTRDMVCINDMYDICDTSQRVRVDFR